MLKEEQIDLRRQRGAEGKFRIHNIGRNRIFSDFAVVNPATGGRYQVAIRGFEVGDNTCECPDFRTNTLGTCKHIEAVLATLRESAGPGHQRRKAVVTRPEISLRYGEQLQLAIHLPARHSAKLAELASSFFDKDGLWASGERYDALLEAVESVPEPVTIFSDALEFMSRECERRDLAEREKKLLGQLERGKLQLDLLKVPLYPYQMRGAIFAAFRGRSILGDDMGLGKTIQTMAAVELLARERGVERVLVIAPTSVKYQWESEIRKFTDRQVQVIEGGHKMRRLLYAQPTFYRLINYEVVLRDLDELNLWQPDLIVLDEAQRIKNWEAKVSRAVKKLRSRNALVLTGTPLENKLEELYSIVQFVDDRRLGPAFQFLHEHRVIDEKGKLVGYRKLDKIRERLEPILLRRTRSEVLKQLPERTDQCVFVEMTEQQRGPYAEQQHTLARLVHKKYLTEVERRRVMCCITNMRMLCNSTFLYDKTTNVSPKLVEFAEIMRELVVEGGHKVVVFSQWELMQRKAAEVLAKLGIGHVALNGSVPGKARRELLEKFRDNESCKVFLSTDAGGTGLNLQSADTVINLELPWNPAVLNQRVARVHRLGQHRPVRVINLVTRGTIEERVLQALDLKTALFEGIFAGTSDEVDFSALGQRPFLETLRKMIEPPAPVPAPASVALRAGPAAPAVDGSLVDVGVQLLEGFARLLAGSAGNGAASGNGNGHSSDSAASITTNPRTGRATLHVPLPQPETLQRGLAALQSILQNLGSSSNR